MQQDKKKVIVADDDPGSREVARNTLMDHYDVVAVADDGQLFLQLEKTPPDIILLDVHLSEMGGYAALKMLKNNPGTADIPIVLTTGTFNLAGELEGFSRGAVDIVYKPFSPPLLLKRVEIHVLIASQKQNLRLNNRRLQQLVEKNIKDLVELQDAMLKTLSTLMNYRDYAVSGAVERTEVLLSCLIAEMLEKKVYSDVLAMWDMQTFLQAALLHDVGKIAISEKILLKPGPLTADEFTEMKRHVAFGEKIIEKIARNLPESVFLMHAKIMAGTHHERWDGAGYPRGIAGLEIPLQGRLMALVDVYDALISDRPYKKACSPEAALDIIQQGKGVHFDPALVDVFAAAMQRYHKQEVS